MTLEEALVSVWRQVLEENANLVELAGQRFPVQRTAKKRLRQVDFTFAGEEMRGIEQNPSTRSRWAEMARGGHRVMQFTSAGRFFANVVDGKVTFYRKTSGSQPAARRAET
ncbi:MAG TPA: hypothetical protein VGA40_05885 [Candidatus Acidoferrales bacterium]